MLSPHNGTENSAQGGDGPTAGWNHWLQADPAAEASAAREATDHRAAANGAPTPAAPSVSEDGGAAGSAWSQWLQTPETAVDPGEHQPGPGQPSEGPAPRGRRRGVLVFAGVGVTVAVGAVAAGVGVLMSQSATPAPQLPTPAATPPSAAVSTADAALGGGPGCPPARTPDLVRGNGPGSTETGPDAILAFQHGYYATRSGAAAREVVAPDAEVSPAEVIDTGIATIPAETDYCITITPLADHRYTVLIAEIRPDATRRNYQQEVTVAVRGDATLITRIGPVE